MKTRIMQQLVTLLITIILFILLNFNMISLVLCFSCIILTIYVVNPHTTQSKLHCSMKSSQLNEIKSLATKIMFEDKMTNRKLEIFEIITQASKDFLGSLDPNSGKIERLLTGVVESLNVSNGYMFKYNKQTNLFEMRYNHRHYNMPAGFRPIIEAEYPKLFADMRSKQYVIGSNITQDSKTTYIWIPIHVDGRFTGFMGFDCIRDKAWNKTEIKMLQIVSDIFATWCSRIRSEKLKCL